MEIGGLVEDGFEPVRAAFEENFAERGELGASCAAYVDGRLVVDPRSVALVEALTGCLP